jgi:hypothetical protein
VTAIPAGYYLVQFPATGSAHNHIVRKDKTCACALGADCLAIEAVARYLALGGPQAPPAKAGTLIPTTCPICGGRVNFEPRLCSPMRGAGWVCVTSALTETSHWPAPFWCPGERHYWLHMWAELGRLRSRRLA